MRANAISILLISFIGIISFTQSCLHNKIFTEKPDEAEQPHDKSVEKAVAPLSFEIRYDDTHCKSVGQTINKILDCSRTQIYTCTQNDILTPAKESFLKNTVIPRAVAFWQTSLSVDSQGTSFRGTTCCGIRNVTPFTTSKSYILFISFHPTDGNTLAWAGACLQDSSNGRPVAGHANFGANRVDTTDGSGAFVTSAHELGHALGFSSSLYPSFKTVDSRGALVPYSYPVTKVATERDTPVTKFVTPKITQYVKNYFACQSPPFPGAEIENGGGSGTGGSHFEKRIFYNDFMTGQMMKDSIITPLTLALFEDMGWYKVSYASSEIKQMTWGRNKGCSFMNNKCSTWDSTYFCSSQKCQNKAYKGCTYDNKAKAYCNLGKFSPFVPLPYRYFSDITLGGDDELLDYCPIYQSYSNGFCTDTTQKNTDILGEVYSSDSLCFESTALKTGQGSSLTEECGNQQYILCHRRLCMNDGTTSARLRVYFGTDNLNYVDCPTAGGEIDIYNNLSSKKSSCVDDNTWKTGFRTPANCADFAKTGCTAYQDYGQFSKCPVTCKVCAPYSGTLKCPAVANVCSTSSSNKSLSAGEIAGIAIGVSAAAGICGLFFYKRVNKKNLVIPKKPWQQQDNAEMEGYVAFNATSKSTA